MSSRDKETASAVLVKAKSAKGRRIQKGREGKIHENEKRRMILRGGKTSTGVNDLLSNFYNHFKPHVVNLNRKEKIDPFEVPASGEYIAHLSAKNDASLFVIGSKTKKRARKLLIGRCFDHSILDMIEFDALVEGGTLEFGEVHMDTPDQEEVEATEMKRSMDHAKSLGGEMRSSSRHATGNKPLILFQGSLFDVDSEFKAARNLLFDLFRGSTAHSINLQGIDHLLVFTALRRDTVNPVEGYTMKQPGTTNSSASNKTGIIQIREYTVSLLRGEGPLPKVSLDEVGTRTDLCIKKIRYPGNSVWKTATRRTKDTSTIERNTDKTEVKKNKSIHTDELGRKYSKLHLEKQDLTKLHTPLR